MGKNMGKNFPVYGPCHFSSLPPSTLRPPSSAHKNRLFLNLRVQTHPGGETFLSLRVQTHPGVKHLTDQVDQVHVIVWTFYAECVLLGLLHYVFEPLW